MIRNFPDASKMEWPKDTPDHRRPANPVIIALFAATGLKPAQGDKTRCADLLDLQHAGLPQPHSAGSASFQTWHGTTETKDPQQRGDLIVFKHLPDPQFGHVTFFDGFADGAKSLAWCVGGNQNDAINRKRFPLQGHDLVLHSFRTATGYRV